MPQRLQSLPAPLVYLITALGWFLAARLSLLGAGLYGAVCPIWLASGCAISCLLLFGNRAWPGVLLGIATSNAMAWSHFPTAVGIVATNFLEVILAARLLGRTSPSARLLDQWFVRVIWVAVLAGALSASLGILTLALFDGVSPNLLPGIWSTWFTSNALGDLLLPMATLACRHEPAASPSSDRSGRLSLPLLLLGWMAATAALCFLDTGAPSTLVLFGLLGGMLIQAYHRFSRLGLAFGLLGLSLTILTSAAFRGYAIEGFSVSDSLIFIQLLLGILLCSGLLLFGILDPEHPGDFLFPAAVLATGWLAATLLFTQSSRQIRNDNLRRFEEATQRAIASIRDKEKEDFHMLLSGQALYAASKSVEREEWRRYVKSLRLQERHSGILGVGVVMHVPSEALPAFLSVARADETPGFQLHGLGEFPPSPSPCVIKYIEPEEMNARAVGLDLACEPIRREALEESATSGRPIRTKAITLMQDPKSRSAFLVLLPFRCQETPPGGPPLPELQAWTYVPMLCEEFFQEALSGNGHLLQAEFRESSGEPEAPRLLLGRGASPSFTSRPGISKTLVFDLFGKPIVSTWSPGPGFLWTNARTAIALALGTMVLTVGLTFFVASLTSSRRTAERKEAARLLQDSEERLSLAAKAGGVGVWDWNITENTLVWDPTMYRLYGLDPSDFKGAYEAWTATLHPEDRAATEKAIQDALAGLKDYEPEFRILLPDGRIRHIKAFSVLYRDPSGKPQRMVGTNWDITEKKRQDRLLASAMKHLEQLSAQDPLTGAANRRVFDSSLRQEWNRALRNASPLSLLMIDVDHFKHYNDTRGHQEGDACLQKVTAIVRALVNRPGDLTARYGGEEFVVLLPNTLAEGALQIAERIRTETQASDTGVTVSIGCATRVPDPADTPEVLLRAADEALYRAKNSGRNRVVSAGERSEPA